MYIIRYEPNVLKKDIPALPEPFKSLIKRAIEERLTVNPIGFGKPLRYSLKGHRRLRVGDYRIVYRIDAPSNLVIIFTIQHRKDVYDQF
jgi:mRNA interferase RelE/StbE